MIIGGIILLLGIRITFYSKTISIKKFFPKQLKVEMKINLSIKICYIQKNKNET